MFCASLNRKVICLITISHKLNPEFHEGRMSDYLKSLSVALSHTHKHNMDCIVTIWTDEQF